MNIIITINTMNQNFYHRKQHSLLVISRQEIYLQHFQNNDINVYVL